MANGDPAPEDVAHALTAKVYEVLTGGGASPLGSFVSIVNGGYAITSAELAFLKDMSTQTNVDLAAHFANVVDRVPVAVGTWDAGADLVQQRYKDWLHGGIKLPVVTLTTAQQAALTAAEATLTSDYTGYSTYRNLWQAAQNNLTAATLLTPRPANYELLVREAREKAENALQDWENLGNKAAVESALGTKTELQGLGYTGLLANLQSTYDTVAQEYADSDGNSFAPVYLVPSDVDGPDVTWNQVTFTEEEISKYVDNSLTQSGGGLQGMEDLFWYGGSYSYTSQRSFAQTVTDNIAISFEYARLALDRTAWFDDMLLTSQAWTWGDGTPQNPAGSGPILSDGVPPPATTGVWQMTPQEVLLTRNLSITMDMTNTTNQQTFTKLSTEASVGFLFWRIAGASYTTQDQTSSYTFTKTDSGIFAPQMQITAFVCNLMPKEPNPGPSVFGSAATP